jgi:hypothetical protein
MRFRIASGFVVAAFVSGISCGSQVDVGSNRIPAPVQPDPPSIENSAADLFGLRIGARWTYLRSGGALRWKEITACEDVPLIDGDTGQVKIVRAYVRENRSELGLTSVHYLTADENGVHRVRRDDVDDGPASGGRVLRMFATYKPPGARLLNGPYPPGQTRTFSLRTFEHSRLFASPPDEWGVSGFSDTSALDTVLEPEALVVVAGPVETIAIERQWTGHNAHNVISHYAPTIGEVRERTIFPGEPRPDIQIEELVAHAPGYGTCDPTYVPAWDPGGPLPAPLLRCDNPWGTGILGPTDPRVDPDNCGACGVECASGVCAGRRCVEPAAACAWSCEGTTVCCPLAWGWEPDGCTNPSRDPFNCGGCDNRCSFGQICDYGSCTCMPGTADCGRGTCQDLLNDPRNCGACGNACPGSTPCNQGVCGTCVAVDLTRCDDGMRERCVDLQWDKDHCGGCNQRCGKGTGTTACEFGVCVTCEEAGQTDCNGDCADLAWSDKHCGICGNECAEGDVCVFGSCIRGDGTCDGPCAETDQICCDGECIDPRTSDTNCGGCNVKRCTQGCTEACRNGDCVPVDCGGGDD